jgi:hypothetical protein
MPGPSQEFIFHGSVSGKNLGPNGGLQRIGEWKAPPWLFVNSANNVYDRCDPEDRGAPTVGCTLYVELSMPFRIQEQNGIVTNFSTLGASLIVKWGSGETDDPQAEMDMINGTSFPLIAKSAQFFLNYQPGFPAPNGFPTTQPNIDVSISVGLWCHGSQGHCVPRRTVDVGVAGGTLGNLAAGQSSSPAPVPPFGVAAILSTADTTASSQISLLASPNNAASIIQVATLMKQEFQKVPLRNGSRGFVLTNTSGAPSVGNAVIFTLALA